MTHPLEAVAWTLIHFCWQAAAVAALYRVISIALARRSSQARYIAALSSPLLMLGLAGLVGTYLIGAMLRTRLSSSWDTRAAPDP